MSEAIKAMLAKGTIKKADRNPAHIEEWISTAEAKLADARIEKLSPGSRFLLAYEGIYAISTAFMNHNGARMDGEGHRNNLLQLAAQELGFCSNANIAAIHRARNRTTYTDPIPPVNEKLSKLTTDVLELAVTAIRKLIPAPAPPPVPT
jgi:hypothetical protein